MANNKVIANGETLIDLTEDTVTPSNMISGIVAHDASGVRIVGTFDPTIFAQKTEAIKNITRSGTTFTATRCDNTTFTFDQQDTNTTYSAEQYKGLSLNSSNQFSVVSLPNIDARSTNQTPSWYMTNYRRSLIYEFKENSYIGTTGYFDTMFCNLFTVIPWNNSSGGLPIQFAVDANRNMVIRSASSNDAWDNWFQPPRVFHNVRIKTGSSNNSKISIDTLVNYLVNNKYIPATGLDTEVAICVEWSYSTNDILQTDLANKGYEMGLAGAIIKFVGNYTSASNCRFRLDIEAPPSYSFTLTSGYNYFPEGASLTYVNNGSGYNPAVRFNWRAVGLYTGYIGSGSDTTQAAGIKNWFNSNKNKIPRNIGIAPYSVSMGNGTVSFGYFLKGYDTNPYGGFFVCHYNWPKYVGISAGTYTEHNLISDKTPSTKVSFTPTTGTATTPSPGCWYAKYGKVVELTFNVSGLTAGATSYNQQITTLPAGYRPQNDIWGVANNDGVTMGVWIRSSGEVYIKPTSGACHFHTTFIVE